MATRTKQNAAHIDQGLLKLSTPRHPRSSILTRSNLQSLDVTPGFIHYFVCKFHHSLPQLPWLHSREFNSKLWTLTECLSLSLRGYILVLIWHAGRDLLHGFMQKFLVSNSRSSNLGLRHPVPPENAPVFSASLGMPSVSAKFCFYDCKLLVKHKEMHGGTLAAPTLALGNTSSLYPGLYHPPGSPQLCWVKDEE